VGRGRVTHRSCKRGKTSQRYRAERGGKEIEEEEKMAIDNCRRRDDGYERAMCTAEGGDGQGGEESFWLEGFRWRKRGLSGG